MRGRSPLQLACTVSLITLVVLSALVRFSARDHEWTRREQARELAQALSRAAEARFAALVDGMGASAPEPGPEVELQLRRSGNQWLPIDDASDAARRLAARLDRAWARPPTAPDGIASVHEQDGEKQIVVWRRLTAAPPRFAAAVVPLRELLGAGELRSLREAGFDHRLVDRTDPSAPGATITRSGVDAMRAPEVQPLRLADRAWTLEVAPPTGWRGGRRANLARIVLAALLSLASGLWAFALATRPRATQTELDALQARIDDLSAQLDLTLDDFERAEERLKQEAHFDPGTGLPNRRAFTSEIDASQRQLRRNEGASLAVAAMTFPGLARLRDSLGREASEGLVGEIAARLRGARDTPECVGRIGDAALGVTVPGIANAEHAIARIRQFEETLREPFVCAGQEVFINAVTGLVLSSSGFEPGEQLLSEAGLSMQAAVESGDGAVEVFDPARRDEAVSAMRLESRLRRAIEEEVPEPFFQPIVHAEDGRIAGMEVLVRWSTPTDGMIAPDHFVPLAEETGLVVALDRLVLRRAARQIRAWRERLPEGYPFYLSVNLSAFDLREPDVCEYIQSVLSGLDVPPSAIRLELTESAIIGNVARMIRIVAQLRSLGFKVLLDDFGTGYSSLSYLHKFRFDVLKIDRSFITELGHEGRERDIVRAILSLAEALDLQVVAEGVETEEQYQLLRELGCDYCQGYLFSRPLPGEEAGALLFESIGRGAVPKDDTADADET